MTPIIPILNTQTQNMNYQGRIKKWYNFTNNIVSNNVFIYTFNRFFERMPTVNRNNQPCSYVSACSLSLSRENSPHLCDIDLDNINETVDLIKDYEVSIIMDETYERFIIFDNENFICVLPVTVFIIPKHISLDTACIMYDYGVNIYSHKDVDRVILDKKTNLENILGELFVKKEFGIPILK